jgi:hypothetical protein
MSNSLMPFRVLLHHQKDKNKFYFLVKFCLIFLFGRCNPHTSKEECEKLVDKGIVDGCGKPFQLNLKNEPEICDYI